MAVSIQISGFDKDGFFDSVSSVLKRVIADTESLLFIASSPDDFLRLDEYTWRIFHYFHQIGLKFTNYQIINKRMPDEKQVPAIHAASCLFLMGGYARVQFAYLKEQNLISSIINHEGVVIGLSAGAINMAKRSVIANPYYPPVSVYNGIGRVNTTVTPHFDITKEDFIKNEILPLTYEGTIYGMCDDGVIVTKNGSTEHNGTVYELKNGVIRLLSKNDSI